MVSFRNAHLAYAATWFALAALCAAGLVLLLEIVNRFVLVRLYPPFHQALAAATLTLAPFVVLPWLSRIPNRGRSNLFFFSVPAVVLACAALVPWSAKRLAGYDNYRLLLVESAPIAREAVEAIGASWK